MFCSLHSYLLHSKPSSKLYILNHRKEKKTHISKRIISDNENQWTWWLRWFNGNYGQRPTSCVEILYQELEVELAGSCSQVYLQKHEKWRRWNVCHRIFPTSVMHPAKRDPAPLGKFLFERKRKRAYSWESHRGETEGHRLRHGFASNQPHTRRWSLMGHLHRICRFPVHTPLLCTPQL